MVKKPNLKNTMAPLLLGVVMLIGLALSPAYGQSNNGAQVQMFPLYVTIDALDCTGELIHVTGIMHTTFQLVDDESGKFYIMGQVNFAQVTGEGLSSGTQYRVVSSSGFALHIHADEKGGQQTERSTFRLITTDRDGSTEDVLVHGNIAFVFNANGEVTAEASNFKDNC
jgi:hypothetical protein